MTYWLIRQLYTISKKLPCAKTGAQAQLTNMYTTITIHILVPDFISNLSEDSKASTWTLHISSIATTLIYSPPKICQMGKWLWLFPSQLDKTWFKLASKLSSVQATEYQMCLILNYINISQNTSTEDNLTVFAVPWKNPTLWTALGWKLIS